MIKNVVIVLLFVLAAVGVWYFSAQEETQQFSYIQATSDDIVIQDPRPGGSVSPSFVVTGVARGYWYFEASFSIEVLDANGARVGLGIATADGGWMTEEFVPFSAPISVPGYSGAATLVLHKDNPSGLSEHDASVSFPIVIE